jgi:hypothetical protein
VKQFDPAEYFPGSLLCDVVGIFTRGDIPDELLPKSAEDWAAISMLKRAFWNITDDTIAANARRLKQRLPVGRLCLALALDAYPYIRKASDWASTPSSDTRAETVALANDIAFNLMAPSEGGVPGESVDRVYRNLSHSQLWLIHLWPSHPKMDFSPSALPQRVFRWLDGVFLSVALSMQSRWLLETLAPHARPKSALDFLLGRTENCDWYLASEMRLRTQAGNEDLMEFLTTEWAGLPSLGPEKFNFKNENPKDRRMRIAFGEASLEPGWETHPDPRNWLRKTTHNMMRRRQKEDERDFIKVKRCDHDLSRESDLPPGYLNKNARPLPVSRGVVAKGSPESAIRLAPPVNDPLAAILPVSEVSINGLHFAQDIVSAAREVRLSDNAARLLRARAASCDRRRQADLAGLSPQQLKATEEEIRRALPALREKLAPYHPQKSMNRI